MMSLIIMIEVRGFLISCTIPEPIRPISASFSDWMSTSSMRFFSVRSCEIAEVPTTAPAESRIVEKAISTGMARPSFASQRDLERRRRRRRPRAARAPRDRRARLGGQQERPVPPERLRLASSRRPARRRAFQLATLPRGVEAEDRLGGRLDEVPEVLEALERALALGARLDVLGGRHEHVGGEDRGERRHQRQQPAAAREGDHGRRGVPGRRRAPAKREARQRAEG